MHVLLWDYDSRNTQRLSQSREDQDAGHRVAEAEKRRAGGARGLLTVGDPGREAEEGAFFRSVCRALARRVVWATPTGGGARAEAPAGAWKGQSPF